MGFIEVAAKESKAYETVLNLTIKGFSVTNQKDQVLRIYCNMKIKDFENKLIEDKDTIIALLLEI